MIKSRQNLQIKKLYKLKQKKYRDETSSFLISGEHAISEALKCEYLLTIYTYNKEKEGILIAEEFVKELSEVISYPERIAVVKKPLIKPYCNKILMLDGIQDPGNLGTLIRTAVGFGFTTIIASGDTADYYNSKTIRATQGNLFYANLIKTNLQEEILKLKEKGYKILVTSSKEGQNIKTVKKLEKVVLVLGNEGLGVSEEVISLSDLQIFVKTENIESLNVSTAGAIIMYELGERQ